MITELLGAPLCFQEGPGYSAVSRVDAERATPPPPYFASFLGNVCYANQAAMQTMQTSNEDPRIPLD